MKVLIAVMICLLFFVALSASEVIPMDPNSPIPTSAVKTYNTVNVTDMSDMKVAVPVGVENNPFYYNLETLTEQERQNARINIEFMGPVSENAATFAMAIEQKWNNGYFDEALLLFSQLNEIQGIKGNALLGINWRNPIPAPYSDWGSDVQVSARDSVFVLAMDHHNSNNNLFAMLGFTGDGQGSKYTANISTDGGANWAETYALGGFTYVMNDLDVCCVANHFYVAYSGGGSASPNSMAWLKRFKAADGQPDTMPNGSSTYNIFNTTEITDLEISSNQDQYNNRLYFCCIENGGVTHFYWNIPSSVTWTGIAMNITDALQGLDMNWNLNYSTYALIISFINDANQVKIYGADFSTFDNLYTYGINSTYNYYTTSCGGHDDTLFCAFNYHNTYNLVQYLIQYGGGSWYYGNVGSTTENNYAPDATLRGAGGIHCVYRGSSVTSGYYRWRPYSGAWSTPEQFNDHNMTGDIRPEIEFVGSGAYGILYRNPLYDYGICYFDRSDVAVAETPVKSPSSFYVKVTPNIVRNKATLSYAITKPGNVHLSVYNAAGRLVNTVVDGYRRAGSYTSELSTNFITPGVYFLKVSTPDGIFTKRLTIVK